MSVRRVAVLVGLCLAPGAATAKEARVVGFANLGGSEAGSAIEATRGELAGYGYRPVDGGALRAALEEPLAAGGGGPSAPLGRARNHLAAAREAYASFEYQRALGELERVDELLLHREPTQPMVDVLVQRHLLAGQVHEGRERPFEAMESFQLVRNLEPGRTALDPGEYRPRLVELYKKTRPGRLRGSLELSVAPEGARVWVDGKAIGTAPVEARNLGPGPHWVVASAFGYSPRGELVEVTAGKRRTVSFELEARDGSDRVAEVRRSLAATRSRDELEAGAAELAGAAGVDVIVLVRGRGQKIEGAAFDTARGELGAWAPLPSRRFWLVLAPSQALGGEEDGTGGALTGGAGARDQAPRSWYQTGWGKGVIIGGGALVAGVILYAVLATGSDTYEIGGWCFAGEEDCQ